jgi:hypothetical protein
MISGGDEFVNVDGIHVPNLGPPRLPKLENWFYKGCWKGGSSSILLVPEGSREAFLEGTSCLPLLPSILIFRTECRRYGRMPKWPKYTTILDDENSNTEYDFLEYDKEIHVACFRTPKTDEEVGFVEFVNEDCVTVVFHDGNLPKGLERATRYMDEESTSPSVGSGTLGQEDAVNCMQVQDADDKEKSDDFTIALKKYNESLKVQWTQPFYLNGRWKVLESS